MPGFGLFEAVRNGKLDRRHGFVRAGFVLATVVCSLWFSWGRLHACTIPVFRYAMQRWPADRCILVVFYRNALSKEKEHVVKWLEKCASREEGAYANLIVYRADLENEELPSQVVKIWENQKNAELPWGVLRYPRSARIPVDAWSGPITRDTAKELVDSPVRRKAAKRLVNGECGVWVFLESGQKKADDAAFKRLKGLLDKFENEIQLPQPYGYTAGGPGYSEGPVSVENGETPEGKEDENSDSGSTTGETEAGQESQVPQGESQRAMHPSFSTIRVSRDNPAEKAFVSTLLGTEPDLRELTEPMTFPMFGRGRVLWAIVGKGIREDIVGRTCYFLASPCACTVKYQNPGVDMLLNVDWEAHLWDSPEAADAELPELTAVPALVKEEEKTEPRTGTGEKSAGEKQPEEAKKGKGVPEGGTGKKLAALKKQETQENVKETGKLPQKAEGGEKESGSLSVSENGDKGFFERPIVVTLLLVAAGVLVFLAFGTLVLLKKRN